MKYKNKINKLKGRIDFYDKMDQQSKNAGTKPGSQKK